MPRAYNDRNIPNVCAAYEHGLECGANGCDHEPPYAGKPDKDDAWHYGYQIGHLRAHHDGKPQTRH